MFREARLLQGQNKVHCFQYPWKRIKHEKSQWSTPKLVGDRAMFIPVVLATKYVALVGEIAAL